MKPKARRSGLPYLKATSAIAVRKTLGFIAVSGTANIMGKRIHEEHELSIPIRDIIIKITNRTDRLTGYIEVASADGRVHNDGDV